MLNKIIAKPAPVLETKLQNAAKNTEKYFSKYFVLFSGSRSVVCSASLCDGDFDMPMTNAQRQAAYRRRKIAVCGQVALNVLLPEHVRRSLGRMARHSGLTQGELLARLVRDAEKATIDGLSTSDGSYQRYYSC